MKNKNKVLLISSFLINILLIISVVYIVNDKTSTLKTVKNTNEVKNKQFAVMLQNESGGYAESESSSWPTTGYELNTTLTNCTDETGTKLENVLRYENGNVAVKSNKKLYCYLYFDSLSGLCTSGSKLGSCLIEKNNKISSLDDTAYSGMYRYTGTDAVVNNNYVCFGTDDKEECLDNPDKYMYRMIGVTSEAYDTLGLDMGQVKLIKDTSIGPYKWYNNYTTNITWESSSMYTYLQGSEVLGNTNVISSGWSSKIDSVKWHIGDVLTRTLQNVSIVSENEKNKTTNETSKLGLIYLSDYFYAYSSGGEYNCYDNSCSNWITNSSNLIWTMTRFGDNSGNVFLSWAITTDGKVYAHWLSNEFITRPVFYLNSDEVFVSGMGTEEDPIMLEKPKETASETIIRKDTENDIGLQQTIITGDDLYRFSGTQGNTGINNYVCLGTTSKCASGSDNMYRIIGINPTNGELKVIKETTWNSNATVAWNSNSNINTLWLSSPIYTGTVKGIYDTLSFKDIIVANHNWNIGTAGSTPFSTRESIVDYENNTTGTANIGILSLTDYYLAYNGNRNWSTSYDSTTNWIGGSLNGNTSIQEWTMTYAGYDSTAGAYVTWGVNYNGGGAGAWYMVGPRVFRPTFYLKPNIYITNPEATGSSTDPFILAY